jgi:hypothetical protein
MVSILRYHAVAVKLYALYRTGQPVRLDDGLVAAVDGDGRAGP